MAASDSDEWRDLERAGRLADSAFADMDVDADPFLGLARPVRRRSRPAFWAGSWQEARARKREGGQPAPEGRAGQAA